MWEKLQFLCLQCANETWRGDKLRCIQNLIICIHSEVYVICVNCYLYYVPVCLNKILRGAKSFILIFYRWHLLTPLNLQWSFSALHNDKTWSLSVLGLFWQKRAWTGPCPSIILTSWPHRGHLSRWFTTGRLVPIRSVQPYQPHDGRGGLLINQPDRTETPQMSKNNNAWCEKADRVSQPRKFSRYTWISTAHLNQSMLHTAHFNINDSSKWV